MINHQNKEQELIQESANQLGQPHHEVVIVMVPLPAQGHLNQLLHLSRLLLVYNLPVHFVGTTTHNRQTRLRSGLSEYANGIIFHDFTIPPFLSPLPDPNAPHKFPSHLQPSFVASSSHLREPVARLLRSLSSVSKRVIVIHDSLMGYVVQDVASIPNTESYNFHSVSAFANLWYGLERYKGKLSKLQEDQISNVFKDVPLLSLEGCFTNEFLEFISSMYEFHKFKYGNLHNTSKIIERPYIDLIQSVVDHKKHWAIGPFNPLENIRSSSSSSGHERHFCLEWLDKQAPNSVIYISFGTTSAIDDEQIKELAIGLEQSRQKFIWVLRDADKGDIFDEGLVRKVELPKGYEDIIKEMGIVIRDWAPQLEILNHESTGGFMSHCGWNSCMESITMGVPILTWPMHSDQPRNAVLVTRLLKVGIVVREWERREETMTSKVVEDGLNRLMSSKEGDEIRKRAAELGGALRRSMEAGGVSRLELDSFIAHITRK